MENKKYINIENKTLEEMKLDILKHLPKREYQSTYITSICPECNKEHSLSCITFLKRDNLLCRKCKQSKSLSNFVQNHKDEWVSRWRNSIQEKYGVDNICYDKNTQEKKKKTCLEKYGNEYAIGSEKIRNKINKTFEEKFNGNTPFASEEVQRKAYESDLKNHGGVFHSKTNKCKNKAKETCRDKYGKEAGGLTEESFKKRKETNLKKYGVEETFASKNNKDKRKETMLEKYGVEYSMQDVNIRKKVLKNRYDATGHMYPVMKGYRYDDKNFDSSYELAYYIWLRDNNKQFIYHPGIPLKYIGSDNKEHLYMPDFLVEGQFIEIKGDMFFNKDNEPWDPYKKDFWWEKYNSLKENNVKILRDSDLKPIFNYIKENYGKTFLKECKSKEVSN